VTARGPWAVAAAVLALASGARAQVAPPAPSPAPSRSVPFPPPDPPLGRYMARDERVLFGLLTATYGFRLGTAINLGALGRTVGDPEPETFWIIPGALTIALPVTALLIERRHPLRRGRGLSAGTGGLMGYLAATSIAIQVRGESFPSGITLSGWATFIGTTSGIALGALVGHLTDAPPADALFVGTGGVGGALLGGLLCGSFACGPDLGAWALTGEVALLSTALAVRALVRPTQPTMRLVGMGALGLGLLTGGGVLLARSLRDGEVSAAGAQQASVFGLGGLLVGAATFFALGRRAEAIAATTVVPTAQVTGQGVTVGVTVTHP
jgi:hypothetical protein